MAAVLQIDAFDPVAGAAVTLRAASHDDPTVCMINGQTWYPVISKLPALKYDLFDGAFGNQISDPSSSLQLITEIWPDFGRYNLAGARVQLWTGSTGAAWSSYVQRIDGQVKTQPKQEDFAADLDIGTDSAWLDTPLLAIYAGTGEAEGGTDLSGTTKPLALGAPRYVPGVLIDAINSVFQVSAYGTIAGFDVALDELVRFGPPSADYASYDGLVAAAILPGSWATCRTLGLARLGAPPAGKVSFLIRGDAAGTDGWARRPGAIIRRIANIAGGAGKYDDASLTGLDAAAPYNLSVYVGEQTTARELIQSIAQSVNATAGVSWLGKLFVAPVKISASVMTLAADGSALPPVESVTQENVDAPWWRLSIGALRCWNVHDFTDIAFEATLNPRGTYKVDTVYRDGDIVSLPSGAEYLYISSTPGAGHALPVAPDTQNTWWAELAPATTASDIAYDDGTPIEVLKPAEPGSDVTGNNTSNDTSNVSGRAAGQLIADVDLNAETLLAYQYDKQTLRDYVDGLLYVSGTPVNTAIASETNQRIDGQNALAQKIGLIGAVNSGGDAFIINLQTVQVGNGVSMFDRLAGIDEEVGNVADSVTSLNSQLGSATADITSLQEVITTPSGGASARALLQLGANGHVVGMAATNDGTTGSIIFNFDSFQILTPGGVSLFQASGDTVKMPNVEVDTLKAGAVVTDSIASSAVTEVAQAYNGSQIVGNGSMKALVSINVTLDRPGDIIAIATVAQTLNNGAKDWAFQITVDGNQVYSITGTTPQTCLAISGRASVAAGAHTVVFSGMGEDSSVLVNANNASLITLRRYK